MEIKKIHQDFSVCKVMDYSLVNIDAEYSFIGKTDEEKSLVCITNDVPPNVIQRDDGWKGFRIQGILDFSLIYDNIDNDRSSEKRGYGIKRNDAEVARKHAQQIAQQCDCTARKHGCRYDPGMI